MAIAGPVVLLCWACASECEDDRVTRPLEPSPVPAGPAPGRSRFSDSSISIPSKSSAADSSSVASGSTPLRGVVLVLERILWGHLSVIIVRLPFLVDVGEFEVLGGILRVDHHE